MQPTTENLPVEFVNRRNTEAKVGFDGPEKRQFSNDYSSLKPDIAEFAQAVDQYKMLHRRRFVTYEELFDVMSGLGYHK